MGDTIRRVGDYAGVWCSGELRRVRLVHEFEIPNWIIGGKHWVVATETYMDDIYDVYHQTELTEAPAEGPSKRHFNARATLVIHNAAITVLGISVDDAIARIPEGVEFCIAEDDEGLEFEISNVRIDDA